MKNAGSALMGIGRASGENRAVLAAQQAVESPLIEVKIEGARGVLFSVAGGYDMSMSEVQEAAEVITGSVSPDANIIFGASIRPELEDEIVVTVVATGFDSDYYSEPLPEETKAAETPEPSSLEAKNFAVENKTNMWDSIKSEPVHEESAASDDDMDVPPSLRERLRGKKKKD